MMKNDWRHRKANLWILLNCRKQVYIWDKERTPGRSYFEFCGYIASSSYQYFLPAAISNVDFCDKGLHMQTALQVSLDQGRRYAERDDSFVSIFVLVK